MSNKIEYHTNATQNDGQSDNNTSEYCTNGIATPLLLALFTRPLDRKFIIELESNISGFIDSDARTVNLDTMNSYHRFLSYKVADYHELKHTILRKDETPAIVLYKDTIAPMTMKLPLLKDLKQEDFSTEILSATLEKVTLNDSNDSDTQLSAKNLILKNKKVKLLKRSGKRLSIEENDKNKKDIPSIQKLETVEVLSNNLSQDSISSLEEQRLQKEKEYEETKLKIFNDNQDINSHDEDCDDYKESCKEVNSNLTREKSERDIEENIWGQVEGSIPNIGTNDSPQYYKSKPSKWTSDIKNSKYNNYNCRQDTGYSGGMPLNPMYPSYPTHNEYQGYPLGTVDLQYMQQIMFSPPLNGYNFQNPVPYMSYQPQQRNTMYNGYNIPINGYGVPYNRPPPSSSSSSSSSFNKNQSKKKIYGNDTRTPSGNGYPNE